jgi:hypothetical protein
VQQVATVRGNRHCDAMGHLHGQRVGFEVRQSALVATKGRPRNGGGGLAVIVRGARVNVFPHQGDTFFDIKPLGKEGA